MSKVAPGDGTQYPPPPPAYEPAAYGGQPSGYGQPMAGQPPPPPPGYGWGMYVCVYVCKYIYCTA